MSYSIRITTDEGRDERVIPLVDVLRERVDVRDRISRVELLRDSETIADLTPEWRLKYEKKIVRPQAEK